MNKTNTKLILIAILALFIIVPVVSGTISYTETMEHIDETGWINGQWNLDKDAGSAPANSVAEIIGCNMATSGLYTVGVRNTSSTMSRSIDLNEAEGGGNTTHRFLVQVDGSGNVDFAVGFAGFIDYYLVGYWEGVTFQENWVSYQVGSTEDGFRAWHETDGTELNLVANKIHLITASNTDAGKEYEAGIRNTTSTLARLVDIMEGETTGEQCSTFYVVADASSKIDVYAEQYDDVTFYNQGYFVEDTLTFKEDMYPLSIGTTGVWETINIPRFTVVPNTADLAFAQWDSSNPRESGTRETGSSLQRKIKVRNNEGGGRSIHTMSVNIDANGNITLYENGYSWIYVYSLGYFSYETTSYPNNASLNYALTITDMDDIDNLYSEKKYYNLDYDGYDLDGYSNVSFIKIYINQSVTSRAIFNYNEDTNTFSLISGNWEIDIGNCVATRSGTDLNLTFKITPSWNAIEESDIELEATINDGASNDHDLMQTDYADVITTLLTSSIECVDVNSPDRTNVGVNIATDFSVRYADNPSSATPSNDYPPDAEFTSISIYDSVNNNEGTDVTIVNGDGSVSFSESTVQSETYNLYVNMNDADYTDAEITTPTETIIWDRIIIYTLGADDSRIDINTVGTWYSTAQLEYDAHLLGVGDSYTLSIYGFTWNGTYFTSTDNKATTQQVTINVFDLGSEATYGITVGNINGQSQDIIWDRIIVTFLVNTTTPNDGTPVKFTVDLEYEYDSINITSYFYQIRRNGTIYQNNRTVRAFSDTQNAPTKYIYDITNVNETLYDLTAWLDDSDITVQWFISFIIGDVNLLFGGGFNHSIPYVYIRWNHSGDVDNYEIQHSTDNITYTFLIYTPNKYYNHTNLLNGSYHYYRVRSTYFVGGGWQNSSYSPINLERVWFIHGSGGGGVVLINGSWREYNISSITIVKGTYVSGNLASMIYNDVDYYIVDEVIGVEGFDIRTNFTNIPEEILSLSFRTLTNYVGNPAHDIDMEVFNHSSNSWIDLYHKTVQGAFEWGNHSLSLGRGINNLGNVWCRVVHHTSGVDTHYIELDYIKLRGFVAIASIGVGGVGGGNFFIPMISMVLIVGTIGLFSITKRGR